MTNVWVHIDILGVGTDERGFYATTAVSYTPGMDFDDVLTILRAVANGHDEDGEA